MSFIGRWFTMPGGGSPAPTPMPAPAPTRLMPEVEATKADLRLRLQKAGSRAKSQVMPFGLMSIPPVVNRPSLADLLG